MTTTNLMSLFSAGARSRMEGVLRQGPFKSSEKLAAAAREVAGDTDGMTRDHILAVAMLIAFECDGDPQAALVTTLAIDEIRVSEGKELAADRDRWQAEAARHESALRGVAMAAMMGSGALAQSMVPDLTEAWRRSDVEVEPLRTVVSMLLGADGRQELYEGESITRLAAKITAVAAESKIEVNRLAVGYARLEAENESLREQLGEMKDGAP